MRFYSAAKDRLVTRYGTGAYIGATVSVPTEGPDKGKTVIVHNEEEVVAITDAEFSKYAREYLALEREGSLTLRPEADWKKQVDAEAARLKKEVETQEAAQKKAEADAKAAEQDAAEKKAAAEKAQKETAEREAADKKPSGKKSDKS